MEFPLPEPEDTSMCAMRDARSEEVQTQSLEFPNGHQPEAILNEWGHWMVSTGRDPIAASVGWAIPTEARAWRNGGPATGGVSNGHNDNWATGRARLIPPQPAAMTGDDLRMTRLRLKLTQARLALLLDLTRVTICLYEKGHARVPKVVQLAMETLQNRASA